MKKSLLALCAAVMAFGAYAETYKLGEAFAYPINPSFKWFDGDNRYAEDAFTTVQEEDPDNPGVMIDKVVKNEEAKWNVNWPYQAMDEAAHLATNTGLAMPWYAFKQFGSYEAAAEALPVVEDPWNRNEYAIKATTTEWWGYGNFNFALPKMEEVSRIRVIYRVVVEGDKPSNDEGVLGWVTNKEKPFHVRLTDKEQDQCLEDPKFTEVIEEYWDKPGYRVIDLYYTPNGQTYLALTWDAGGLTCGRDIPLYVEEVSVVPVSKIEGDTHVSGDVVATVTEDARPDLVVIEGGEGDSINEIAVEKKQGIYDLQGRKLAAPAKGINIINGVKTIVK